MFTPNHRAVRAAEPLRPARTTNASARILFLALAAVAAASRGPAEGNDRWIDPVGSDDVSATPITAVASSEPPDDDAPIVPAAVGMPSVAERFYVSGIVGGSFATATSSGSNEFFFPGVGGFTASGSTQQSLFTGGAAIGMAIPRADGQLRMEIEGRSRGPFVGNNEFGLTGGGQQSIPLNVSLTGGWSTMTNFWRDWSVGERLDLYGGGGFGAGGYQARLTAGPAGEIAGVSTVTAFAWQAGGGVAYAWSDRVAFDVGYRYFSLGDGATDLRIGGAAPPFGNLTINLGSFATAFNASELLLSLRVYEPFRGWR